MNCRICLGVTNVSYLLRSRRHELTVQTFYCPNCNAFFSNGCNINYENTDLTKFYLNFEVPIRARYRKIFEYTESLIKPGRFLDIGAGIGFSLEIGKQRGWRSSGLEPNTALVEHAMDRGLDIIRTYLDEKTVGEYDFILIDNVLEHISDLSTFLGNVTRLLAPNGITMIAVPPMDWLRKKFGEIGYIRNSVELPQINIFGEVDEHVNIFSRNAMHHLIQSVGLRLLNNRFHHSIVYNNPIYRGLLLDDGYYFAVHS